MLTCNATFTDPISGRGYYCTRPVNHDSHHQHKDIMNWVDVKSPLEWQIDKLQKQLVEQSKEYSQLREVNSSLSLKIEEQNTKLANQAKSLTEMHKRIDRDRHIKDVRSSIIQQLKLQLSSVYGKTNTDLIAERNDLYNKVQRNKNLQERLDTALQLVESNKASFEYNVKSYEESIATLKERIKDLQKKLLDKAIDEIVIHYNDRSTTRLTSRNGSW